MYALSVQTMTLTLMVTVTLGYRWRHYPLQYLAIIYKELLNQGYSYTKASKISNISERVLDRDIVTIIHRQDPSYPAYIW